MVTKKPKGLGLGLEALLGPLVSDAPPAEPGTPTTLPLSALRAGKYQEDRIFKRPFSFPMAPRAQPSTRVFRSLKVTEDC